MRATLHKGQAAWSAPKTSSLLEDCLLVFASILEPRRLRHQINLFRQAGCSGGGASVVIDRLLELS